mgnify:CR=1 FL=1
MPIDLNVLPNTITVTPMAISIAGDLNWNGPASGAVVSNIRALIAPIIADEEYLIVSELPLLTYNLFVLPDVIIKKGYKITDEDSHEYYVMDRPFVYKCPWSWENHHLECKIGLNPDS